jgi:hypothetical protein
MLVRLCFLEAYLTGGADMSRNHRVLAWLPKRALNSLRKSLHAQLQLAVGIEPSIGGKFSKFRVQRELPLLRQPASDVLEQLVSFWPFGTESCVGTTMPRTLLKRPLWLPFRHWNGP